ncbi:MAG: porin family protein [Gemmatimonadota bacterium]|nr:porin family protein [Gemmatimonadota bacterium]
MRNVRKFLTAMAVAAVLLPGSVAAQDVLIGVKGGINSANVSLDPEEFDTSARTAFVGGLFAEFGLSDLFAIRPEALYSGKGFKGSEGTAELEFKANYIEIPVLLVARLGSSSVQPVLFAGPVIAFESSCDVSASDTGLSFDSPCDEFDEGIETKSTDFGAAFGAGVEIDLGGFFLLGDARYNLGFTDVADDEEASVKNRGWSFQGGIGIGVG